MNRNMLDNRGAEVRKSQILDRTLFTKFIQLSDRITNIVLGNICDLDIARLSNPNPSKFSIAHKNQLFEMNLFIIIVIIIMFFPKI